MELKFNLNGTFMTDCDDYKWDCIVKSDGNASPMRYKQWPFYDDSKEIFGKDGANGESAADILAASHGLNEWERTGQTQLPVPAQKQKGKKRILHSTMMRLSTLIIRSYYDKKINSGCVKGKGPGCSTSKVKGINVKWKWTGCCSTSKVVKRKEKGINVKGKGIVCSTSKVKVKGINVAGCGKGKGKWERTGINVAGSGKGKGSTLREMTLSVSWGPSFGYPKYQWVIHGLNIVGDHSSVNKRLFCPSTAMFAQASNTLTMLARLPGRLSNSHVTECRSLTCPPEQVAGILFLTLSENFLVFHERVTTGLGTWKSLTKTLLFQRTAIPPLWPTQSTAKQLEKLRPTLKASSSLTPEEKVSKRKRMSGQCSLTNCSSVGIVGGGPRPLQFQLIIFIIPSKP